MQKRMESVEIATTTEGVIELSQQLGLEEPDRIVIYPEQVPALVQWLEQARAELMKDA